MPESHYPIVLIFLGATFACIGCMELGFRTGRRYAKKQTVDDDSSFGTMMGAMLGLLAFMLAFTFSLASDRFQQRKAIMVQEANAIGTAALRARYLPEPFSTGIRSRLADYTENRSVRLIRGEVTLQQATEIADRLTQELWHLTEESVKETTPSPPLQALFVTAMNDVIDLNTARISVALRFRIPEVVWVLLSVLGVLTFWTVGTQAGATRRKRTLVAVPAALAFGAVFALVYDLDHVRFGWIRIDQTPMLELASSLRSEVDQEVKRK